MAFRFIIIIDNFIVRRISSINFTLITFLL